MDESLHTSKITISPRIAIVFDGNDLGLMVTVELPGAKKEHIDLTVNDTSFCIAAELDFIHYKGSYLFGYEVDEEKAKAKFEEGKLILTIPVKGSEKRKRVIIE